FGKFNVTLRPSGKNLIIESGFLHSKISDVNFSGVNYCMECGPNRSFVDMQAKSNINDLGALLTSLGYKDTVSGGKGAISASIQWNGRIDDFDITRVIATINVDIKDGKFLKIDTSSSILSQLIGIMNLQYLFNFVNLSFGDTLQNGFYFNKLTMHAYVMNSKLNINDLDVYSASTTVSSHGVVDLENDTINMRMSVTPHLSTSVAVAAGVATLQPLVGLAVYAGELLLGSPTDKLFTVSFHISGSLSNPIIEQIGVAKQVEKNVKSTISVGGKSGT
ncbi:MAG TPA: AsmA-like C-terminal region-containing protein, partial [Aquella sp.]|nr:AsmA-like C-terminal region-containing protein [Aquella sp.]